MVRHKYAIKLILVLTLTVLNVFLAENTVYAQTGLNTIVIDAGHGGRDGGCSGHSHQEKDIALKIARSLGYLLKQELPTLNIVFTREKDEYVSLENRAKIANDLNADLFVSIHCNAIASHQNIIHGPEIYVLGSSRNKDHLNVAKRENAADMENAGTHLNTESPEFHIFMANYQRAYLTQSVHLAQKMDAKLAAYTNKKTRGVLQAGFYVLREVAMPSVLVETGYLTNADDATFLASKQGQRIIVAALLEAIYEYDRSLKGLGPSITIPSKFLDETNIVVLQEGSSANTYADDNHQDSKEPALPSTNQIAEQSTKATQQTTTKHTAILSNTAGALPKEHITKSPNPKNKLPTVTNIPASVTVEIRPNESKTIYHITSKAPPLPNGHRMIVSEDDRNVQVQFRVQIASSPSPLNLVGDKWTAVGAMETRYEDGMYKYLSRPLFDWDTATQRLSQLKAQGFRDAFIVAYQGKRRIDLQNARSLLTNP